MPVIAYDLPVSVHTKLARETVTTLAREGAIVGLKDSSGDAGGSDISLPTVMSTGRRRSRQPLRRRPRASLQV